MLWSEVVEVDSHPLSVLHNWFHTNYRPQLAVQHPLGSVRLAHDSLSNDSDKHHRCQASFASRTIWLYRARAFGHSFYTCVHCTLLVAGNVYHYCSFCRFQALCKGLVYIRSQSIFLHICSCHLVLFLLDCRILDSVPSSSTVRSVRMFAAENFPTPFASPWFRHCFLILGKKFAQVGQMMSIHRMMRWKG